MNNDLIKRYIYAVVCHLPVKAQPEIEKELEGMIADLLDARCGGTEPSDEDIRAVLTELGSPEELSIKYSGDENKALISGIYFLWFKKILKIVLPIAVAGAAFAIFLSSVINLSPAENAYEYIPNLISNVIGGAVQVAVQAFMWITIVFVILERKKVNFNGGEFISKLPPVPDKRAQIKLHEPIINICLCVAAAILFLFFPYLIGAYIEGLGWTPAFSESYVQASWYLIALWPAFIIFREVVKLTERRYNRPLIIAVAAANILTGISAVLLFADSRILNPQFVERVSAAIGVAGTDMLEWIFSNINIVILTIILFALTLDLGKTVYRSIKYDNQMK